MAHDAQERAIIGGEILHQAVVTAIAVHKHSVQRAVNAALASLHDDAKLGSLPRCMTVAVAAVLLREYLDNMIADNLPDDADVLFAHVMTGTGRTVDTIETITKHR